MKKLYFLGISASRDSIIYKEQDMNQIVYLEAKKFDIRNLIPTK